MSDDNSQKPEPTTEEILASIRRIIADDEERMSEAPPGDKPIADPVSAGGESAGRADSEPRAAASGGGDDADDILELTERVDDSEESVDQVRSGAQPEERAVAVKSPAGLEPISAPDGGAFVSAAAAEAVADSFAELAKALDREPEAVRKMALGEGNTLEDVVKEQIRPMLKAWLDENLPTLVEQLVRKEIQRMVKRAEGS